jgi:hypothetical protein
MSGADTSSPHSPQPLSVSVEGSNVRIGSPDSTVFIVTPAVAVRLAESLLEAADQARRAAGARSQPPFPPSDLVSPHGAG